MSSLFRAISRTIRKPSSPKLFPTTGFDVIDNSYLVEEETSEWYKREDFYPVRVGEVFRSKYQIVGKLGYGSRATVWLCRDLIDHRHLAFKIGPTYALERELSVLRYLQTFRRPYEVSQLVRDLIDEFEVVNNNKTYQVIIHSPLAITLRGLRRKFGDKLPANALKSVLQHLLVVLDFLHTKAKVIHTDIQEKNIIFGLNKDTIQAKDDLARFELQELESPSPRKIDGDRVIHVSRPLVPPVYTYGRPVLCDLGEARFRKDKYTDDIQPYQYEVPKSFYKWPGTRRWISGMSEFYEQNFHAFEFIVFMSKIWDLFEDDILFKTKGGPESKDDNIYHLAHMIALLGPPLKDFLERTYTDRLWQWFDADGKWKGAVAIPDATLDKAVKVLEGEDKAQFLQFVRKMLTWKPEQRETAKQLLEDPWLKDIRPE